MSYTDDQIIALTNEVEDQGGVLLEDMCAAKAYKLTGPKGQSPDGSKRLVLAGCGNRLIFEFPYEARDGSVQPIRLCAICDDLPLTPRFREAVFGA